MKVIDFEANLISEIRRFSIHWDFRISLNQRFEKILLDYLTVRSKIIEPKKRLLFLNPEFKDELKNHPKKDEIVGIMHNAAIGNNLNCFLSKRILQSNFHDHLQNEWNIFHFHLSLEKPVNSYFVKQVDGLLLAYITEDEIVFLGTEKHREGIFGDTKWIEILHDHFPEKISKYKDRVITEIYPKVNASERQTLWNKGYTIGMTKVRNTVYHSPGLGRATSGHGINVTRTCDSILRWIHEIKKQLTDFESEVCEYLQVLPEKAEFKIVLGNISMDLIEIFSGKVLLNFPHLFRIGEENKM